jgi:hypothetical protein
MLPSGCAWDCAAIPGPKNGNSLPWYCSNAAYLGTVLTQQACVPELFCRVICGVVQARELQSKYEKQMKILRDDLELRRKQDLQETEERKNAHIRELMRKHRQAFNEIKNYYNDITSNNLDLIKTLKEDVAEMKKKEALNEKLMYEISTENKRLSEPLNRALKARPSCITVFLWQLQHAANQAMMRNQATTWCTDTDKQRLTRVHELSILSGCALCTKLLLSIVLEGKHSGKWGLQQPPSQSICGWHVRNSYAARTYHRLQRALGCCQSYVQLGDRPGMALCRKWSHCDNS